MVTWLGGLPRHEGMAVSIDPGAHEQVEGIVHVVRRQAVFALRFGLDVVAIGVHSKTVSGLIDVGAAERKQYVVSPVSIFENIMHRPVALRCRPHASAG